MLSLFTGSSLVHRMQAQTEHARAKCTGGALRGGYAQRSGQHCAAYSWGHHWAVACWLEMPLLYVGIAERDGPPMHGARPSHGAKADLGHAIHASRLLGLLLPANLRHLLGGEARRTWQKGAVRQVRYSSARIAVEGWCHGVHRLSPLAPRALEWLGARLPAALAAAAPLSAAAPAACALGPLPSADAEAQECPWYGGEGCSLVGGWWADGGGQQVVGSKWAGWWAGSALAVWWATQQAGQHACSKWAWHVPRGKCSAGWQGRETSSRRCRSHAAGGCGWPPLPLPPGWMHAASAAQGWPACSLAALTTERGKTRPTLSTRRRISRM